VQRLLITGGCGYLGRELVRLAPSSGWDVRATWWRREPPGEAEQPDKTEQPGKAEWLRADVRDVHAMRRAVEGVDAVIHTAYLQGADEWSVNVDGTAAVAAAARGRRFVHLSSDLVFDGMQGGYREADDPGPVNSYGRSKAEAELRALHAHGRATLARTSLIYGGSQPGPQERLAVEGTRFYVDEIRSPVQVEDLARALLEVLDIDVTGPLHLGGAHAISRFDFAVLLGADAARVEGVPTTPDRAPDVSLDSSLAGSLLQSRLRGVYDVL
jgi:dTDP-4-dehydrorhamnose reductase